ncbi:hypothetical protein HK405_012028, partial [Cladochytrium tenue]
LLLSIGQQTAVLAPCRSIPPPPPPVLRSTTSRYAPSASQSQAWPPPWPYST